MSTAFFEIDQKDIHSMDKLALIKRNTNGFLCRFVIVKETWIQLHIHM